jgi:hypothetical protein
MLRGLSFFTQEHPMARPSAKPSTPATKEPAQAPIPSNTMSASARSTPSGDQIARRAYELYLSRGGQPGNPEQDWLQAERELMLSR